MALQGIQGRQTLVAAGTSDLIDEAVLQNDANKLVSARRAHKRAESGHRRLTGGSCAGVRLDCSCMAM